MAISKVVYGNNTLVDLTSDTVSADNLPSGITAHRKDGVKITGTLDIKHIRIVTEKPTTATGNDGDLFLILKEE